MGTIEDVLIPILGILSTIALPIGFGMYLGLTNIRTRHKENIELIKQGIIPPPKNQSTPNRYRSLRNGFLCLGIGIGLMLGFILKRQLGVGEEETFFVIASSVLLFLGLAYVLFYMVVKNKDIDE